MINVIRHILTSILFLKQRDHERQLYSSITFRPTWVPDSQSEQSDLFPSLIISVPKRVNEPRHVQKPEGFCDLL